VLSDRDRATLHEIQIHFLADDPGFVETFDNRPQAPSAASAPAGPTSPNAPTAQRRRTQRVFMWIAALLCMLLPAAAGPSGGALLLAMGAVAVLVLLYRGSGSTDGASRPRP